MYWEDYIPLEMPVGENMSDDEFFAFCAANRHIKIERNEHNQIIIMPPSGLDSHKQSLDISCALCLWNKLTQKGKAFSSSAGFILPDKSVRSPDAAWLSNKKWNSLSKEEREKFGQTVPEFIVEVKSPSDDMDYMDTKMKKWIQNGVCLGWLIEPKKENAYIYRSDKPLPK